MTFKKHMPIALVIAFIAAVLQAVDQLLQANVWPQFAGYGWIAFQAWAVYFLAGCTPKGGLRGLIGYALGIIGSIGIFTLGGWLGKLGLGFWAMPVCLVIAVTVIMQLEIAPELFNFVPSVFVGAGVFFGITSYIPTTGYVQSATIEMVYCAIGLFCGFLTICFNNWYIPKYVEKTDVSK
ncbi:MAG: DUF1097 domain-containing protein [Oscillospiraceae bacterium]